MNAQRAYFNAVACVVFVVLVATCNQQASATLRYNATRLQGISQSAIAYAINNNGVVVGADRRGSNNDGTGLPIGSDALIWDATGNVSALAVPVGTTGSLAVDVSDNGVIVGVTTPSTGSSIRMRAHRWTSAASGEPADAGLGASSFGVSVTSDGLSLVAIDLFSPSTQLITVRDPANGLVDTLVKPPGTTLFANRITEDGRAIGRVFDTRYRAFISSPDNSSWLVTDASNAIAEDMNLNSGVSVGWFVAAGSTGFPRRAASFTSGIPAALPTSVADVFLSSATAINERGDIVQWVQQIGATHGELVRDGLPMKLQSLVQNATGWSFEKPLDINNRGQIVGFGKFNGILSAFRLDPIRHPGDATTDGVTNFDDLLLLAANYNRSGNGSVFYETGDFNYDWRVDFDDLLILAANYNTSAAPAALARIAIPEPAALLGASLLACTLIRRPRRS